MTSLSPKPIWADNLVREQGSTEVFSMIFNNCLYLWQVVNAFLIDVNVFSVLFELFSLDFLRMLKVVFPHLL